VKQAKESGHSYGDFNLAVRNRRGETTYYPVRCFGKLAESVTHIKKGARIFVVGSLEIGSFTGAEGKKQMTFRVIADTYRLLGNEHHPKASAEAAEQ
jgi:single-stranded DNA-binding protein